MSASRLLCFLFFWLLLRLLFRWLDDFCFFLCFAVLCLRTSRSVRLIHSTVRQERDAQAC